MEAIGIFFMALVMAFLVEALLEYVFGIWWQPISEALRPKLLMAFGLVLGIVLCILYKIDLVAELGFAPSIIGQILTGALVGRGSDYLHAIWKKLKPTGG